MQKKRVQYPLNYRRARTLLFAVGAFWLWVWFGSAGLVSAASDTPAHAFLAIYALSAAVLVSLPAAALAAAWMLVSRPAARTGSVHQLQARPPASDGAAHWWYENRAS